MPLNFLAEQKIRQAMADGAFERLPNAGRPISLEEYFAAPEHLRAAHVVLKNAGCVPEEVELLREIAALEARPLAELSPADRLRLDLTRTRLAVCLERRRTEARAARL